MEKKLKYKLNASQYTKTLYIKAPCGQESDMYVCESFGVLINQFYITEVENVICFNLLEYPYLVRFHSIGFPVQLSSFTCLVFRRCEVF